MRTRKTVLLTVAAASALALGAQALPASAAAPPTVSTVHVQYSAPSDETTAINETLVVYMFQQLLYNNDSSLIDKYVSPTYIQHNPTLSDGPQGLRQYIDWRRAQNPQPRNLLWRVVAQGDLVSIQNVYQQNGADFADIVDTFRVENGKLAEHWDVIQFVTGETVGGNDLYSTLSSPRNDMPDPTASTRRSEQIVESYFNGLWETHNPNVIDRYLASNLYQHDPVLPNGSAAVLGAYETERAAHPNAVVSSEMWIAQGDYVTVRYHYQPTPADRGQAVAETFRVRDGKIVEHWDVVQDVPATSANPNTMF
jgi:predicted SnoaL-like aldol condensation-catalyzing enzyme